nr:uncharacterized protein LOC106688757 [Halyomorpha halys]
MKSNNDRFEAAFFITSMLSKNVELRDDLVRKGFVEKLIRLLKSLHGTPSSLVWLFQNNDEAQDICKRPEYHFEMIFGQLINEYGNFQGICGLVTSWSHIKFIRLFLLTLTMQTYFPLYTYISKMDHPIYSVQFGGMFVLHYGRLLG